MEGLKLQLYSWSSKKFGNVPMEIKKVYDKLNQLEGDENRYDEFRQYHLHLQELLDVDNEFWKQRSKSN